MTEEYRPHKKKKPNYKTNSQRVNTTPDKRKEISPHQNRNQAQLLERMIQKPESVSPHQIMHILEQYLSKSDIKQLQKGNASAIIKKYAAIIKRKYVQAVAAADVLNYCSATPAAIPDRSDEIRLETMEQLRRRVQKKFLSKEKFQQIHQTFFADIVSKDSLPNTQITKMLRCIAAGKLYAPTDLNGKLAEYTLSPAYRRFRQKPQPSLNLKPENYDFFGIDAKGKPLCPMFYATSGSANAHKISKAIAKRMAQLGIAPSEAYKFNVADIAHIMQKDGELRDIPFSEIAPDIKDSPYQEFADKLGLILKIGRGKNNDHRKTTQLWLEEFATPEQKTDYEDYGFRDGLELFLSGAEKIYNKLSKDFAEKGISPDFLDAWAESLCANKSLNPNLAQCHHPKPHKIDIHHWERLSSATSDTSTADKNNLDNFGVMIMYTKNDFDIHASMHKGESASYITTNLEKKQQESPQKNLFCTSNFLFLSLNIFHGRKDRTEELNKIDYLRSKKGINNPKPILSPFSPSHQKARC